MFDLLREVCSEQWKKKPNSSSHWGWLFYHHLWKNLHCKIQMAVQRAHHHRVRSSYRCGGGAERYILSTGEIRLSWVLCCCAFIFLFYWWVSVSEPRSWSNGKVMGWQQVMGKEILGEKRNEITWLLSKYLFDDEIGDRRYKGVRPQSYCCSEIK